jgi:hypothetical protein
MKGIGALEFDDVMGNIYINGFPHIIFTTYHDSNEVPESSCTNRMISFLIKDRVYQYLNIELEEAYKEITAILTLDGGIPDKTILCVITKFRDSYCIDWPVINRQVDIEKDIGKMVSDDIKKNIAPLFNKGIDTD